MSEISHRETDRFFDEINQAFNQFTIAPSGKPEKQIPLIFDDLEFILKTFEGKDPYKRRKATWKERVTPCNWCGHPVTVRHHFEPVKDRGENHYGTMQLCANCHELYHMAYDYVTHDNTRGATIFMLLQMANWNLRLLRHAKEVIEAVLNNRNGIETLIPHGNYGHYDLEVIDGAGI